VLHLYLVVAVRNMDGVVHPPITAERDATLLLVPAVAVTAPQLPLLRLRRQCRKMDHVALRAALHVLVLRSETAVRSMVGVARLQITVVLRAMEGLAPVVRRGTGLLPYYCRSAKLMLIIPTHLPKSLPRICTICHAISSHWHQHHLTVSEWFGG
jgi:hypothetical protein